MSPRDIVDFFLRVVPNPQIRTALVGPPHSDEHPLLAAEAQLDVQSEKTQPTDTAKPVTSSDLR